MFSRPVDHAVPIKTFYGDKGKKYTWSIDPDNGFWVPIPDKDGLGQHCGTDFSCEVGTLVRAMVDGIIIRARFENPLDFHDGAGLYILQLVSLLHFDNWVLRYTHMSEVFVKPGDSVLRGQPIGESGDTGNISEPFLHVDLMNLKRQWQPIPLEN